MPRPSAHSSSSVRQWRLSLTEDAARATYTATLAWRTFPCAADHWDGRYTAQILSVGPPIQSPADLEAVLALFVEVDWSLSTRQGLSGGPKPV